jgi:hypothetical protein
MFKTKLMMTVLGTLALSLSSNVVLGSAATYDKQHQKEQQNPLTKTPFKEAKGILSEPAKDSMAEHLDQETIRNLTKAGLDFKQRHYDSTFSSVMTVDFVDYNVDPKTLEALSHAKTIILDENSELFTKEAPTGKPYELPLCNKVIIKYGEVLKKTSIDFLNAFSPKNEYVLVLKPSYEDTPERMAHTSLYKFAFTLAFRPDLKMPSVIVVPASMLDAVRDHLESCQALPRIDAPLTPTEYEETINRFKEMIDALIPDQ